MNTYQKAKEIRQSVFKMAYRAGGAHLGAAFSVADILAVLYFEPILKFDPKKPEWPLRDRLILSKGHACYALYAVLSLVGYFQGNELLNIGKPGSVFGGHPKMRDIPGIEASTGALGHGLSFGIGIAYANKADETNAHTYVILGDGECQEGSVWEGALSAPALKLNNLTVIIDHNKLQAMDKLSNIVPIEPLGEKWKAFGWQVLEIDGHNHKEIKSALLTESKDKPKLIVAHTIKGKGVSFMENVPIWHYRMPNKEELPILLKELDMTMEDL